MKNVKIPLASLCLILFSFNAFPQIDLNERMTRESVVVGSIIKEGKEIQGYIKQMGTTFLGDESNIPAPWEFQNDIRFMEKDAFEKAEKIKNKDFTKYEAGDIDGYKYQDTLYFESVKYSDMSAVGTGMIAKKIFMKKIQDGKISLFQHFSSPPAIGEVSSLKESYKECAAPNVVYRIGKDGKLKLVNSLNVKKELADCPAVIEKFEKGDYGISGGEEKKSGLAKLADKTIFRDGVRFAAIADYNTVCK